MLCVICNDSTVSICFGPCMHCCCCLECSKKIRRCCICRKLIWRRTKIYLAGVENDSETNNNNIQHVDNCIKNIEELCLYNFRVLNENASIVEALCLQNFQKLDEKHEIINCKINKLNKHKELKQNNYILTAGLTALLLVLLVIIMVSIIIKF